MSTLVHRFKHHLVMDLPPIFPPSPTFRDETLPHALPPLLARAAQDDDSGRKDWKARLTAAAAAATATALGWGWRVGKERMQQQDLDIQRQRSLGGREGGRGGDQATQCTHLFEAFPFALLLSGRLSFYCFVHVFSGRSR